MNVIVAIAAYLLFLGVAVVVGVALGLWLLKWRAGHEAPPPEPPNSPSETLDPLKDPAMAMRLGILDIEEDAADADAEKKRKAVGLSPLTTRH